MTLASPVPASAALALLAAVSWGGGDFFGGMGVKAAGGTTEGALRVVITAHALSLIVLLCLLDLQHARLPGGPALFWGLLAGVTGGLSLTVFYIALARGAMGASAAISGLLAAAIPAVVSIVLDGAPGALRLVGFGCAFAAIWLIAVGPADPGATVAGTRTTTGLAVGAGIGFGLYFVSLRFANSLGVIEPMALARTGSLFTCLILLLVLGRAKTAGEPGRQSWLTASGWWWALGVAVLDTAGNMLFLAATRTGRLDVSAVLASLYPASTILLAAWLLHERPDRRQFLGMAVAVAAVVLITV